MKKTHSDRSRRQAQASGGIGSWVVRRIGGRKSHPDFHRVHSNAIIKPQIVLRCNGDVRIASCLLHMAGGGDCRCRPKAP
jgi:hypothetical protein